jgi:hypothetical protein
MGKANQFEIDPQAGMENLKYNLRRALKVEPSRMDKMVELDNKEREAKRIRAGHKKRGPKPKASASRDSGA